ncbi:MAG: SH3 domain-containing protein [Myxococcota bacterium]
MRIRPPAPFPALLLSVVALWTAGGCKQEHASATTDAAARNVDAGVELPGVVAFTKVSVKQAPDEKARSVTLLSRGERLSVLEKGEPFSKVRLSDGEVGYVQTRNLLLGQITEATLVMDQDLYVRPDALSPVRKRAAAGTLLFVLADKDGWRQVQMPDKTVGWVPRDKAVTDVAEVDAARALWKAELQIEQKRPDLALTALRDFLALSPGARLAPMVEARAGTLDAGPLPSVDAGATATPPGAPGTSPSDAGAPAPVATPAPAATPGEPATPVVSVDASPPLPAAPVDAGAPRPATVLP